MKILLTGKGGQVGWELERALAPLGELIAFDRAELDLADPDELTSVLRDVKPAIIVNAAAYTAVDRAEAEREAAFSVNARAPALIAEEARRLGALLVHYSTDYVFDGTKPVAYTEDDATCPLGVYGASKLAGEQALGASGASHWIFRTSWVYAPRGRNFMITILRLAREGKPLRVVDDQIGAPTSAAMIARATAAAIARFAARLEIPAPGIYHLSAAGQTSWYGFARAILAEFGLANSIDPIPASEYPLPANRPANSLLDNSRVAANFGIRLPDWEQGLREAAATLRSD